MYGSQIFISNIEQDYFYQHMNFGVLKINWIKKYIWDSNFAIVRWCLHELWKNQEREMFPKIFLQSQFQGGRRTVLFRNSNFDPISWFKVFLHEQPCKIWCLLPLFKRGGTDTFFPPSNLTTFYRFLFPQLYYRGKN